MEPKEEDEDEKNQEDLDLSQIGQSLLKNKSLLDKIKNNDESKEDDRDQNHRHSVYDFEILKRKMDLIYRKRLLRNFMKVLKQNRALNIYLKRLTVIITAHRNKKLLQKSIKALWQHRLLRKLWQEKAVEIMTRKHARNVIQQWRSKFHTITFYNSFI